MSRRPSSRHEPASFFFPTRKKLGAETQIKQISACPDDFSEKKEQSANTYMPTKTKQKKKLTPPHLCATCLIFVLSNQIRKVLKGLLQNISISVTQLIQYLITGKYMTSRNVRTFATTHDKAGDADSDGQRT